MNATEQTVRLYEQNRRALTTAIVNAGGVYWATNVDGVHDLLVSLALNNIVITAEYTGEKRP